jgi:hypothetical protein
MWFQRMSLEDGFDTHQYSTRYDEGESAIKFLKLQDLGLDLNAVDLRFFRLGFGSTPEELTEGLRRVGLALDVAQAGT